MAKFFVSYSRSNKDEVLKVINLLQASGHEVWWDTNIPAMSMWWATILDNIEWCEVFIFVASKKSAESAYCLAELKYAYDRQRPILPFMLDDPRNFQLPAILPASTQWLIYTGDPADMLRKINDAYADLDSSRYQDMPAPRPPQPQTGDDNLTRRFHHAYNLANKGEFDEAKTAFGEIKRTDFKEWGTECDEWIGRLTIYADLVDLAASDATLKRFQERWSSYVKAYGDSFNPHNLQPQLPDHRPTVSAGKKVPYLAGILALGAVLIIGVIAFLLLNGGDDEKDSPTRQANLSPTNTLNLEERAQATVTAIALEYAAGQTATAGEESRLNAFATGTAYYLTQAVIMAHDEATLDAQETAAENGLNTRVAELRATDVTWTPTPSSTNTPTNTATSTPLPTSTNTSTPTFTATASFTSTRLPTNTYTPRPSSTNTPSFRNADWTPVEQNFSGVTMVLVPAGCFMMGSNEKTDERPIHEQCFDAPFWIDKYEVTQAQFKDLGGRKANANSFTGDNRPVERITWYEAKDFCELRGGRLPTEREWEYAARGPDALVYPWGNNFITDNVVYSGNSNNQTANVGSRPGGISWVGALDMSGNVREWTSSLYRDYPYNASDGRENNQSISTNNYLVLRGGSWFNDTLYLRAPYRDRNAPNFRDNYDGLRCASSYE